MPQSDATFSMSSTLPRKEPRLRGSPPPSGRAEKAYTEREAAVAAASGAAHMAGFPSTVRSCGGELLGLWSHVAQTFSAALPTHLSPASSGLRPPCSRVGGCGLAGCGHRPGRAEPRCVAAAATLVAFPSNPPTQGLGPKGLRFLLKGF